LLCWPDRAHRAILVHARSCRLKKNDTLTLISIHGIHLQAATSQIISDMNEALILISFHSFNFMNYTEGTIYTIRLRTTIIRTTYATQCTSVPMNAHAGLTYTAEATTIHTRRKSTIPFEIQLHNLESKIR